MLSEVIKENFLKKETKHDIRNLFFAYFSID